MMEKESAWKDHSDGDILQFDFSPPRHWSADRIAAEQEDIAALLGGPDDHAGVPVPGWLRLARRLPAALRSALAAELRAGNQVAGIGSTGWPGEGSIVVNMRNRFSAARKETLPGVAWRELNDPHYCREELSQKVGALEFLIIT